MNEKQHTVLCVDDEDSLKRLLRKEAYRLLTAVGGEEGLRVLEENEVHLVITDQRMPGMNGVEFLSRVKDNYPDVIRIILTGYTDVDSITESINQGHIYKFFLKPWNDQNLKLEIKQALKQYDLIQSNNDLHHQVLDQNTELRRINENLEGLVQDRTRELEIRNQALEISHAVLEALSLPVIGVSADGMIVMVNRKAQNLESQGSGIAVGRQLREAFSEDMVERIERVLETRRSDLVKGYALSNGSCDVDITPLGGGFAGRGAVLAFRSREH
jgi:response regulator RpfG family c-di-GMP phosphodiesterase